MSTIALVAHDGKKAAMVGFVRDHVERLRGHQLIATGTTGAMVREQTGLEVEAVRSGPLGGDVEIAARVVRGELAAVIFFVDQLDKHPHDPDIQTLMRACNVHDVPLATNPATAHLLIGGDL